MKRDSVLFTTARIKCALPYKGCKPRSNSAYYTAQSLHIKQRRFHLPRHVPPEARKRLVRCESLERKTLISRLSPPSRMVYRLVGTHFMLNFTHGYRSSSARFDIRTTPKALVTRISINKIIDFETGKGARDAQG